MSTPSVNPFSETVISSPDGSIKAKIVNLGATLSELWVKDKNGKAVDVVLGYDDPSRLLSDPVHGYLNSIIGRYANRIQKGLFTIPISKNPEQGQPGVYSIPTTDHDGANALHGGLKGWDRYTWNPIETTPTSVTYTHVDEAAEGFPGTVKATVTHTVKDDGIYELSIGATASEPTPILLTQHTYWNLDAFETTDTILDHYLQVHGSKVLEVDDVLIPTGKTIDVAGSAYDFRTPQKIGARWEGTTGFSGPGLTGYDNCYLYDEKDPKKTQVSLWSESTGIRMDISSDQVAVQVYSGMGVNTTRKATHGGQSKKYGPLSAVCLEQQDYIAAINVPEFGVDQIHYPGRDYKWEAVHKFSVAS
ncbi:galactose mutarotase-like protein [Sistotremastrum suecicum HHB10207 ss-3]|uniref:Galactose mutarotase-like protein n=1 Tax=Sistotremastrum suecicum HHB10207 ss-3 TaxID=1314776 RepID=A0A166D948_9AGAM|nr:galactose mutarotase-like protein [Sistotremastrum suecicum HHB10207 ss-3]